MQRERPAIQRLSPPSLLRRLLVSFSLLIVLLLIATPLLTLTPLYQSWLAREQYNLEAQGRALSARFQALHEQISLLAAHTISMANQHYPPALDQLLAPLPANSAIFGLAFFAEGTPGVIAYRDAGGQFHQHPYLATELPTTRRVLSGACESTGLFYHPLLQHEVISCRYPLRDPQGRQVFLDLHLSAAQLSQDLQQHFHYDEGYAFAVSPDQRLLNWPQAGDAFPTLESLLAKWPQLSVLQQPITKDTQRVLLGQAPILEEKAELYRFYAPGSDWQIVMITPERAMLATLLPLLGLSAATLAAVLLLVWGSHYLLLRHWLIRPLQHLNQQLEATPQAQLPVLEYPCDDEIGVLVKQINQHSQSLDEALQELTAINRELDRAANFDPLTALHNRRAFEETLEQLSHTPQWAHAALIHVDLDQFKVINDSCGHLAGDELLMQVAMELTRQLPEGTFVARLGGDEFILLLPMLDRETLAQQARQLLAHFTGKRFEWQQHTFEVGASIGALLLSDLEPDSALALQLVNGACTAAKEQGRNRVYLYQPDDPLLKQRQHEISHVSLIFQVLRANTLELHYQLIQPVANPQARFAMEALLRMRDPDSGQPLSPGVALPVAERYSIAHHLDRRVVERVLAKLASLSQAELDRLDFCSINLSADSITRPEFGQALLGLIQAQSIPTDKLCFEITETAAISNRTQAQTLIDALREIGCRVALDDFGAGMCSYGYLQHFNINLIKLDGSFIRDLDDNPLHQAFVRSMSEVAQALGCETIAEFVEDSRIMKRLERYGIDYAQGYGIARPAPLPRVRHLLNRNPRHVPAD